MSKEFNHFSKEMEIAKLILWNILQWHVVGSIWITNIASSVFHNFFIPHLETRNILNAFKTEKEDLLKLHNETVHMYRN